jgi:hypothetical protein
MKRGAASQNRKHAKDPIKAIARNLFIDYTRRAVSHSKLRIICQRAD